MNLGFESENMLVMDFEGEDANENCQLMKNEILRNHEVLAVTTTDCPPGRRTYSFYGFYTDPERRKEDRVVARLFKADYDFLSTFGLEIVEGREFSPDISTDVGSAVLLTERGVKHLGIDNSVGYKFYRQNGFREVIGVVKDFHGSTLDWGYKDLSVIMLKPEECNTLVLKLPPDDISGSIAAIEETWKKTLPGIDFKYNFLDEEIYNNYNEMRGQTKAFFGLALLTIIVACLGIFGLVAYTAEQKTREIGIRKVLGGTVTGIVTLLSKEFIILIGIANLIAWPVAYLLMQSFLQEFPFRIGIGIGTFLLAAGIVICFALFTSGFQAYKAAVADPVKSLRYE
jgi:putative ABC transport system permease protein